MEVRRSIQAASIAELAWVDVPDGRPQAEPVTPLLFRGEPAVAFPYASAGHARRIAAAAQVALVVSDDRMTSRQWRPLAVHCRPRLVEDPTGELFSDQLLDQELRKYPPARALIDSPMLRREHWWYIPRLIVSLQVDAVAPVTGRAGGAGEVLAVAAGGQLSVDTVRRVAETRDQLSIESLGDPAGQPVLTGPAILLGHDFSVPDLECWTPWTTTGWLRDGVVTVEAWPPRTGLAPPPRLWQRLRHHYRLSRACQQALAQQSQPTSTR